MWCFMPQVSGMAVTLTIFVLLWIAFCATTNYTLMTVGDRSVREWHHAVIGFNVVCAIDIVSNSMAIVALVLKVRST